MRHLVIGMTLLLAQVPSPAIQQDRASDIIQRSTTNTNTDWNAAPQYNFTERDVTTRHGTQTSKTYQVTMICGSPYNKLINVDGKNLPAAQAAQEDRKMAEEIRRRQHESGQARQKRIDAYRRERVQDHALLTEMIKAFQFTLTGTETLNGRRCFVLNATPKSGYKPPSRDTEVLTGMRGRLWVDSEAYQWVRVEAEVFRPVKFGLFLARVNPGTRFALEQQPVQGNLWLPSHLSMTVNAKILVLSRNSTEEETYSDYHRASDASGTQGLLPSPRGAQQSMNGLGAPCSTVQ